MLLDPWLDVNFPFATLYFSVLVAAWYGGFGPAVMAALAGAATAAWVLLQPRNQPQIEGFENQLGLLLYLCISLGIAIMGGSMRNVQRRALAAAERAIRQRNELEITLGSIGDAVIVADKQGRITAFNSMAAELTGWSVGAALGGALAEVFRIINESTRLPVDNPADRAVAENRVVSLANHTLLIARDGTERPIDDSAAPICGEQGELRGVVLVFRDVTERRAANRAATQLAAIVASSQDAIIGKDLNGTITSWNAGAERLYGYTAEEAIGQSLDVLTPPEHAEQVAECLARLQRGETVDQFDSLRVRKDGTRIDVSASYSPIRDAENCLIGASVIARDVSQQRLAERRRSARIVITQLLAEAAPWEEIVPRVLRAICEGLDWTVGALWVVEPAANVVRCSELWHALDATGEPFVTATRHARFAGNDSLPGRVWSSGKPLWVRDVTKDALFRRRAEAQAAELHGAFACPLRIADQPVGVIEFFCRELRKPDEDLLEMMATIGGQIGQFMSRTRAERKLRRSEQDLSDFFENAPAGLHWVSADGMILRANRAELEMLGYARDEYVGRNIADFHVDRPVIEDMLDQLRSGNEVRDLETRMVCKNGTVKDMLVDSSALWERGRLVHARCFTRDITEMKRAEAAVRESERQLRLILDQAPVYVARCDKHRRYLFVNRTYAERFGLIPDQIVGHPIADILGQPAYQAIAEYVDRVLAGEAVRFEVEIPYRIGGHRYMHCAYEPEHNENGEIEGWVSVVTDITQRKRSEDALRESYHRKDEFLATLGHELRNPLAGIVTGVEVMNALPLDSRAAEMRSVIERQATAIHRMVDDLLDVSRIARGIMTLQLEPLDLTDLVRQAVDDFQRSNRVENCEFSVRVPAHAVWVNVDRTRMAQVISNLVHNACKFADGPNQVQVTLTCNGAAKQAVLAVRDQGVGLARETLRDIFEPFSQARSGVNRNHSGLGLGLAVVRGVVALHHGQVGASSEGPGRGSTFTVTLPLTTKARIEPTEINVEGRVPRRVLLIDDRRDALLPVQTLLTLAGHEVETAADGPAGLKAVKSFQPEIVLCDIGLTGEMSGYDVARQLGRQHVRASLYLVAVTGYGQETDRQAAKSAGFDYHLTKPVGWHDLERLLNDMPRFD
jgi:PAS domain S-box-containing protein